MTAYCPDCKTEVAVDSSGHFLCRHCLCKPRIISPSAAAKLLAQLGASKGGQARAKALTPERRREIAKKAGKAPKRKRQPKKETP